MKQINLSIPASLRAAVTDENFRVCWNSTDEGIEIFLTGIVGDEYTQSDSASIAKVLSANRGKKVTMRVNSGGGLAYDGLAIFNAMASHDGPTVGIVEGLAASAASLAVIGCDTVRMYANSTYHIHEGLSFAFGHIADLQDSIDWLEQFNTCAAESYAAKSGKSIKDMRAALLGAKGDGTKYTASEAKAIGFVDEVIEVGKKGKQAAQVSGMQAMLNYRIAQSRKDVLTHRTP